MGPHSTADDRSRYQPEDEIERWGALDPLVRYRAFLEAEGITEQPWLQQVESEGKELAAEVRRGIAGAPPRDIRQMFDWVFSDMPAVLQRQRDEVAELLEQGNEDA
jgi:pyruvate dehydrogenase E1 component alpha subunit